MPFYISKYKDDIYFVMSFLWMRLISGWEDHGNYDRM
jgi:hypothetical protein